MSPFKPITMKQRMGGGRESSRAIMYSSSDGDLVPSKGMIIDRTLLSMLLSEEKIGKRFKQIREWLNEIYDDEYPRNRIAKEMHYSNQGLKNVEECLKETRQRTINDMAKFYLENYNVPLKVFSVDINQEDIRGFYLGRISDKSTFFDDYYEQHEQAHYLDDRMWDDDLDENDKMIYLSDAYKEIRNNGQLDRIRIEVRIKGYQDSTLLWEKRVGDGGYVSVEDLKFLEESFENQIKLIQSHYREIMRLNGKLSLVNAKRLALEMNRDPVEDSN